MYKFLYFNLMLLLLAGCAATNFPLQPNFPPHQLTISWSPLKNSQEFHPNQAEILRLYFNGRLASKNSLPAESQNLQLALPLPQTPLEIVAEVSGKTSRRFFVQPGCFGIQLWFGYEQPDLPKESPITSPLSPNDHPPPAFLIEYQINERINLVTSPATNERAATLHLETINVNFYREGLSAPVPQSDDSATPPPTADTPLQIDIDHHQVFNGLARAGSSNSAQFNFNVERGVHTIQFRIPGLLEKTIRVNIDSSFWISVFFRNENNIASLEILEGTDEIGIF